MTQMKKTTFINETARKFAKWKRELNKFNTSKSFRFESKGNNDDTKDIGLPIKAKSDRLRLKIFLFNGKMTSLKKKKMTVR